MRNLDSSSLCQCKAVQFDVELKAAIFETWNQIHISLHKNRGILAKTSFGSHCGNMLKENAFIYKPALLVIRKHQDFGLFSKNHNVSLIENICDILVPQVYADRKNC